MELPTWHAWNPELVRKKYLLSPGTPSGKASKPYYVQLSHTNGQAAMMYHLVRQGCQNPTTPIQAGGHRPNIDKIPKGHTKGQNNKPFFPWTTMTLAQGRTAKDYQLSHFRKRCKSYMIIESTLPKPLEARHLGHQHIWKSPRNKASTPQPKACHPPEKLKHYRTTEPIYTLLPEQGVYGWAS